MSEKPKERPILSSGEMVRALLREENPKTQTRREIKLRHMMKCPMGGFGSPEQWAAYMAAAMCPYGQPGDRLWVREAWAYTTDYDGQVVLRGDRKALYRADQDGIEPSRWRPSIHMPRWASRITLEITRVRVERVQSISEEDAKAEGVEARLSGTWWQGYRELDGLGLVHQQYEGEAPPDWMIEPHKMNPTPWLDRSAKQEYETLWNRINGPGSWESNPWVWVIDFKSI